VVGSRPGKLIGGAHVLEVVTDGPFRAYRPMPVGWGHDLLEVT
jgi:hypothetical protein